MAVAPFSRSHPCCSLRTRKSRYVSVDSSRHVKKRGLPQVRTKVGHLGVLPLQFDGHTGAFLLGQVSQAA